MNVGSLFSGIGGLDLGLERAGMRVVWQCEADPWCRRVLARHWPGVPCYPDVRELAAAPPVDVLAGGFPCQPVSLAGRGAAQADARWLWPEFARLIRLFRPRYVIAENVPGLLARGLGLVLADLAELGFDAEWMVFGAGDIGAPHLRERVWIVAADACREPSGEPRGGQRRAWRRADAARGGGDLVADAGHERRLRHVEPGTPGQAPGARQPARQADPRRGAWPAEPDVGRVAYGVPSRVDRLRGLGNAVVPACAEHVGRLVMAAA